MGMSCRFPLPRIGFRIVDTLDSGERVRVRGHATLRMDLCDQSHIHDRLMSAAR